MVVDRAGADARCFVAAPVTAELNDAPESLLRRGEEAVVLCCDGKAVFLQLVDGVLDFHCGVDARGLDPGGVG